MVTIKSANCYEPKRRVSSLWAVEYREFGEWQTCDLIDRSKTRYDRVDPRQSVQAVQAVQSDHRLLQSSHVSEWLD